MFQNSSHLENNMMKKWIFALSAAAALLMSGCGESSDNFSSSESAGGYTLFSIETGEIPYPNDILMDRTTKKIHFDTKPEDEDYTVKSALNALDGFSTTAPITATISGDIDKPSLQGRVLLIDTTAGAMTYGTDYMATATKDKIAILPLHPLEGNHRYIVILKKGIMSTDGKPFKPDYITSLILGATPLIDANGDPTVVLKSDPAANLEKVKLLEAIRQHTQTLISPTGMQAGDILDIWSFKTQTIGAMAKAFSDANTSTASLGLNDSSKTSKDLLLAAGYDVNDTMSGNAEVYIGTLFNLPYYIGIPNQSDPIAPLHRSFTMEGNKTLPKLEANLTIPVLATVPKSSKCGSMPAKGWPVVIFQHGITQNRTNLLAISEAFANACYAAVAIDLPLHGIDDNSSLLYMKDCERTFDVDYVTQDDRCNVTAYEPDGKIDCSGTHYVNLQSLLTTRDNMRQSTSDFIALKNALGAASVSADGLKFDSSKISFVGHSLGAMAPYGFLSHRKLSSVVLANPGGGIVELLNNSPRFASAIEAGLATKGILKGTPQYSSFIVAAQTIIDDADPINYAATAAANQKMLSFEVIDDQVIPNSVSTAPLSGTDPLLRMMGAKDLNLSKADASGFITLSPQTNTVTRFDSGTHSSILDPGNTPEVTAEMQTEAASFVKSEGARVQTTSYATSVVKQ